MYGKASGKSPRACIEVFLSVPFLGRSTSKIPSLQDVQGQMHPQLYADVLLSGFRAWGNYPPEHTHSSGFFHSPELWVGRQREGAWKCLAWPWEQSTFLKSKYHWFLGQVEHGNSERKKKKSRLYSNKGIIINIRGLWFPSLQILAAGSYTVLILKGRVPSMGGQGVNTTLPCRAEPLRKEQLFRWMLTQLGKATFCSL